MPPSNHTTSFIRCTECNHRNEFTELITFCDACGKKLKNNFPDWQKQHPGKPIKEFILEYCETVDTHDHHHYDESFPFKTIIILFFFLVLIATGIWFGMNPPENPADIFLPKNTPEEILSQEWQRYSYGNLGFSIMSPEKLSVSDESPSPALIIQLADYEQFYYKPSKGFHLELMALLFKENLSISLQNLVNGTVHSISARPGVQNLEIHQSPVLYDDLKGLLLEGSYQEKGKRMRFLCVVCSRGSNAWQAIASFRESDETGARAAEKAIESLQINYHLKPV